ncbi:EF-hand calcium-binding domain-containing protein 13 [Ochotona princeps]|uniref:EF-hand calcium-binding domain-containing protein 13 n=1 Tax=Ochotona princeps TaxID=9978 RepID=UPI0027150FCF|nr:EF-hand calcium-binding domain-containing protein 13 [Ochotona princeps]
MTRKKTSLYKSPDRPSVCRTSLPSHRSSSIWGEKEIVSNLYLTLYDNMSQVYLHSQEINALHKACKIFSKIRSGKIYVNDLPIILAILKISINDSEMRQALKATDIDVNGMLDFTNFLMAVNEAALVSQDPAFQKALNTFSRIRDGRVGTNEVMDVLDGMDISINLETFHEVLKYSYVDNNHMVDIGDVVFTLNELLQQYEDVSITDASALHETTSKQKLFDITEHNLPYHRKRSLPSKPSDSSVRRKYHSKIMEEKDGSEFKRPKNVWQERKLLSGTDTSNARIQEPYSLDGGNSEKPSEQAGILDSKSENIASLSKSPDESGISGIPELQQSAFRKHSNLLKQVSPKEEASVNTWENVCEPRSDFQEGYAAARELQPVLPSKGVRLLDEESQENAVDATRDVLTDVIKAVDKIKDGTVDYADLNNCLQNFGVYLSKPEFEKIQELTEVDDAKRVNFKKFVDTMLSNTERFSEKLLLPNAVESLHSLSKEKMSVSGLWNTLSSLNSSLNKDEFLAALNLVKVDDLLKEVTVLNSLRNDKMLVNELGSKLSSAGIALSNETFQEILKQASVDENNKVSLKEILENLSANKPSPVFEDINTALKNVNLMNSDRIPVNDLRDAFKDLDVSLKPEEHQMLEKTLDVDENGDISLKAALLTLKNNKRLEDFKEVNELAKALGNFNNKRIDVDEIKSTLKGLGIYFPEEELHVVLSSLSVDKEGKVDLKDFLNGLVQTPYFTKESRLQIGVHDLDNILGNVALRVATEELNDPTPNTSVTGGEIDVKNVLENRRIEPTPKESLESLNVLPVGANAKLYQKKLKDGVKSLKGGIVDVSNLDTVWQNVKRKLREDKVNDFKKSMPVGGGILDVTKQDTVSQDMGMQLSEMESKDLMEKLPVDVNGKYKMTKLMNEVKNFTGKEVDANDLLHVLGDMGIELTESECAKLQQNVPTNASGKVYQKRLLEGVKAMKGGMVKINNLDTVLENLGIQLTEKECENLIENLPISASEKVDLSKLLEAVEIVTGESINVNNLDSVVENMGWKLTEEEIKDLKCSLPTNREKIDVRDLPDVLSNVGIELTDKEQMKLLKNLPVDGEPSGNFCFMELQEEASGEIYRNRLLSGVKSFKGGKVQNSKRGSVLENLGIKLTEQELEDLAEKIPVSDSGNINFSELMDEVKMLTGGEANIREVKSIHEAMGVDLTEKEDSESVKTSPADADDRMMNGVKALEGGKLDLNKLDTVLGNMGMKISEKEFKDIAKNLPVNGGKANVNGIDIARQHKGIKPSEAEPGDLAVDEGMINVSDFNKVLENMEIKRTEKEFEDLTKKLPVNGEDVDIDAIKDVVQNLGIELTDKECMELVEKLSACADRKILQNKLLEGIKTLRGGKIDVNKLDTLLGNMGVSLTGTELEDLTQGLPVNVDGKVDLKKVMSRVKDFTGEKINVNNLETVLENMGVKLSEGEYTKLMKTLPVNDDGTVYQNRLLKGVKSLKRGKVDINNLNPILENMDIKLTEQELTQLRDSLPVHANGRVDLNKVMDGLKAVTGGEVDVNDVRTVLENMGIELNDEEFLELMKNLPFDDDEKIFQNRLLESVKSLKGGKVSINNLKNVLDNMGIKLKNNELKDLTHNLPVGIDKKISLPTLVDKLKMFTGEKIDSNDLSSVLGDLEIELTKREQERLLDTLPTDDAGKIYRNRLLKAIKSLKGGKIHVHNLDSTLEKLGIELTEEELAQLSEGLQVDVNGKTDLKEVMDRVKAITEMRLTDLH